MRQKLLLRLTGAGVIMLFNFLIVALLIHGGYEVCERFLVLLTDHVKGEISEVLEGLGTILVALGVALEERESLMKFLGLYPDAHTPRQALLDHHCHGHGLVLLLQGLFIEVLVYMVRMPSLPTFNYDPYLLLLALALCAWAVWFILKLNWRLAHVDREAV